jgi:hypothetical protein
MTCTCAPGASRSISPTRPRHWLSEPTAAVAEEPELECPVCSAPMTKIWYKTGDDGFIVYHHCPHDDTEVFPHGRRESVIEFVDL